MPWVGPCESTHQKIGERPPEALSGSMSCESNSTSTTATGPVYGEKGGEYHMKLLEFCCAARHRRISEKGAFSRASPKQTPAPCRDIFATSVPRYSQKLFRKPSPVQPRRRYFRALRRCAKKERNNKMVRKFGHIQKMDWVRRNLCKSDSEV